MEVLPLSAIVYNQDKVEMKDVVAPPYDVIDDNYQDNLCTQKITIYLIRSRFYTSRKQRIRPANNAGLINADKKRPNTAANHFMIYLPDRVTIIPLKSAETGRPKRSKRSVLSEGRSVCSIPVSCEVHSSIRMSSITAEKEPV